MSQPGLWKYLRNGGSEQANVLGSLVAPVDFTYTAPSAHQITRMTDGVPVRNHAEWAGLCHDMSPHDFGSGDNFVTIRWTFSAAKPVLLEAGGEFVVRIQDDLRGLNAHTFMIQGESRNRPR